METYALVSRPATLFPPATLDKHKHPSASTRDTYVRCAAGLASGRVEGGMQQKYGNRTSSNIDTPMWPARHRSQRQHPRSR